MYHPLFINKRTVDAFYLVGTCEILDQLRLEITYQYAISHIDLYEGRNNIVHAQESGYLPIRIGGRVRLP